MTLLTDRQRQIVQRLAEGCTYREIAKELHLSRHTIANHVARIREVLGTSRTIETVVMAIGEIDLDRAQQTIRENNIDLEALL